MKAESVKIIRVSASDHYRPGLVSIPIDPPVEVAAGDRVLFVLDGRTEAKP